MITTEKRVLVAPARGNGAEQDRDECRAFDQGVPGGKLGAGEMIRQDAVLDWTKQRGNHPEQKEHEKQQRHRIEAQNRARPGA